MSKTIEMSEDEEEEIKMGETITNPKIKETKGYFNETTMCRKLKNETVIEIGYTLYNENEILKNNILKHLLNRIINQDKKIILLSKHLEKRYQELNEGTRINNEQNKKYEIEIKELKRKNMETLKKMNEKYDFGIEEMKNGVRIVYSNFNSFKNDMRMEIFIYFLLILILFVCYKIIYYFFGNDHKNDKIDELIFKFNNINQKNKKKSLEKKNSLKFNDIFNF
jgi:hypothetical protein